MLDNIPDSYKELLADESKAFVFLATTMSDGSPQVTPVWFNFDGQHIFINSALGRVKDKNMRERPQVALSIIDMQNPYHSMQVRGKVIELTSEGAVEHISDLSQKYRGRAGFDIPEGQTRVIYKIIPEKIGLM
jgi:PPOX class probable F420-dependent enzyme